MYVCTPGDFLKVHEGREIWYIYRCKSCYSWLSRDLCQTRKGCTTEWYRACIMQKQYTEIAHGQLCLLQEVLKSSLIPSPSSTLMSSAYYPSGLWSISSLVNYSALFSPWYLASRQKAASQIMSSVLQPPNFCLNTAKANVCNPFEESLPEAGGVSFCGGSKPQPWRNNSHTITGYK